MQAYNSTTEAEIINLSPLRLIAAILKRPEKSTAAYKSIQRHIKIIGILIACLIAGCTTKETTELPLKPFEAEGKFGFIDAQSNIVVEPKYDWTSSFREGLCAVKMGGKIGFINSQGEIIVPIMYDKSLRFTDGLAGVCLGKECGYIDLQGNIAIPFSFSYVDYFHEHQGDLAIVRKGRKWGAINRSGKSIIKVRYDDSPLIADGYAIVTENGKSGLLNLSGEEVIPLKYDVIAFNVWNGRLLNENLISVKIGGKWGFLNKRGEVQIPFRYEKRSFFRNGYATVQREGKTYRINKSGKETMHSE